MWVANSSMQMGVGTASRVMQRLASKGRGSMVYTYISGQRSMSPASLLIQVRNNARI
jgi:hypothetical protein